MRSSAWIARSSVAVEVTNAPSARVPQLVSLARMLGGISIPHRAQDSHECKSGLFDISIAIELQEMHAKDLSTTVERLTRCDWPEARCGPSIIPHQCDAGSKQHRPTALTFLPGTGCRIEHCDCQVCSGSRRTFRRHREAHRPAFSRTDGESHEMYDASYHAGETNTGSNRRQVASGASSFC